MTDEGHIGGERYNWANGANLGREHMINMKHDG